MEVSGNMCAITEMLYLSLWLLTVSITAEFPGDICTTPGRAPDRPNICACDIVHSSGGGTILQCSQRHLVNIPEYIPADTTELNLQFNDIRHIRDHLWGLHSVTFLTLASNRIVDIEEDAFAGLSNLTELHLDHNNLTSLPPQLFTNLHSLATLSLASNQLQQLQAGYFVGLPGLRWLYLDNNHIMHIDSQVFLELGNLRVLNLSHNDIVILPWDLFDYTTLLTTLHLGHNPLQSLPQGVFDNLSLLSELDFQHCRLTHLMTEAFSGLDRLYSLDVSYNRLQRVPELSLSTLHRLVLDGNPVEILTEANFQGLAGIEELSLHHMPALTTVDSCAFCNLTKLLTLDLSNNAVLAKIAMHAFEGATSLTSVTLNNNALTTLSEGLLNWEGLDQLALHGNPWMCDCRVKWLHYLLQYIAVTSEDILCAAPPGVTDHRLQDVHPVLLVCTDRSQLPGSRSQGSGSPGAAGSEFSRPGVNTNPAKMTNDIRAFLTFCGLILGCIAIALVLSVIQKYRKSRPRNPPPEGAKCATTFTLPRWRHFSFQRLQRSGSEEMDEAGTNPCDV